MAIGIEDKIKALEEKLKQAKAQKAKIEARKKAEQLQELQEP